MWGLKILCYFRRFFYLLRKFLFVLKHKITWQPCEIWFSFWFMFDMNNRWTTADCHFLLRILNCSILSSYNIQICLIRYFNCLNTNIAKYIFVWAIFMLKSTNTGKVRTVQDMSHSFQLLEICTPGNYVVMWLLCCIIIYEFYCVV
jgi:hypothetical protein